MLWTACIVLLLIKHYNSPLIHPWADDADVFTYTKALCDLLEVTLFDASWQKSIVPDKMVEALDGVKCVYDP